MSETPPSNDSFEETIRFLDKAGQSKILCCLEEITKAFASDRNTIIPTETVAGHLIVLEKNIGHNSLPPLLASVGITVEKSGLSLTNSINEIGEALSRIKDIIASTPHAKPQPTFRTPDFPINSINIHQDCDLRKRKISDTLPPLG